MPPQTLQLSLPSIPAARVKSTSRASQHIKHKSGSRQKKNEPSKQLHIERKVKVKEASLSNLGWTYWGI